MEDFNQKYNVALLNDAANSKSATLSPRKPVVNATPPRTYSRPVFTPPDAPLDMTRAATPDLTGVDELETNKTLPACIGL